MPTSQLNEEWAAWGFLQMLLHVLLIVVFPV